ncbi:ribonuclease toxin immunity protein CdiI [Brevibacillus porteri]|uniref:CDI immunity protein domain-containing protein n=1 Tax=Brevibacillus porteri TaxID=2126350 RepID=A0ABX5FGX0_9BACL|nr:ribonuclease toxin immunity protein CdiI [Brevibacillus porteri]MED1801135.1 ribonuclease toxin immunity protein CdiI [Brevibacillus porteri]MED2131742.1 ribonuclease toxin immunity protein CdiI [Brevibacillus porteri]MED2743484.1 ribonuclease toxin immunity protein CdiI [Brevibacillus porteri]MED2817602.1 ribonuclease toxin immunity protein CdiI [Brevibacillus porteri]MED2897332.1 ribonuclease toxin immunity protein CdiI [Brevibacillus porteri]
MRNFEEYAQMFPNKEGNFSTVIEYFFLLSDHDFMEALESMAEGYGFSANYRGFNFPDSYHPEEDGYFEEGVEFFITYGPGGETNQTIIDNHSYVMYLEIACNDFLTRHSQFDDEVKRYLAQIRDNLNLYK